MQCIDHLRKHYDPAFCAYETIDGILQQQQQWNCHRRSHKHTAYQHIWQLWRCAEFFTAPLQCHYQQSTMVKWRFTLIHMLQTTSDCGAVEREKRTILGTKSKLQYSEIALSQKSFRIGHMYIYTFLLRMSDTVASEIIQFVVTVAMNCWELTQGRNISYVGVMNKWTILFQWIMFILRVLKYCHILVTSHKFWLITDFTEPL
jgi:hypothetical protein